MKKVLALLLLTGISIANAAETKKYKLVSIDSLLLMQKSKEGQLVAKNIQQDIEKFQLQVKSEQEKLANLQEEITKQKKVLSNEALQKKTNKLVKMKKKAERKLADNEEILKEKIQKEQIKLRNKQIVVVNSLLKEKEWGMIVDKQTPGVLAVNSEIDVTDEVLKAVNKKYDDSVKIEKNTKS